MPLFKVLGRTHPVELFNVCTPERSYYAAAIETALSIHQTEKPGNILLFLTGKMEIENCRKIKLKADDLMFQNPATVGPLACIPIYSSLNDNLSLTQRLSHAFQVAHRAERLSSQPIRLFEAEGIHSRLKLIVCSSSTFLRLQHSNGLDGLDARYPGSASGFIQKVNSGRWMNRRPQRS